MVLPLFNHIKNKCKYLKQKKQDPYKKKTSYKFPTKQKRCTEKILAEVERQEKINALKAQVQSGDYKVDNEKVAEKIFGYWFK